MLQGPTTDTQTPEVGVELAFGLKPMDVGLPPKDLVRSNNADGCPRWGGTNTPLGEAAPPGLADSLLRCPVGQMPYCKPKANPMVFQCLSFTASLCKCVEAVNKTLRPPVEFYNGGAKKCCSLTKGGKAGSGHSAGIACSPNGKGGRRCCTVEAQCIGKFDEEGNASATGDVSNGIRCCWDDAATGNPSVPAKCEQTLCPPGSYNCGDGNFDVAGGCPKFDDALNPDHRVCQMVFDQSTGLGRDPRSPVPLPAPVQCVKCTGVGATPTCEGTKKDEAGKTVPNGVAEPCSVLPFRVCPAAGTGWSDAPGPNGCGPR